MKTLNCLSILLAMSLSAVFGQPVISSGGIRNAASNALDGLPNSGIAQGSYFTIYGSKLGPDIAAVYSGPLPYKTTLAGTSVKVAVNGTSVDAAIYFTGANQSMRFFLPARLSALVRLRSLTMDKLVRRRRSTWLPLVSVSIP